MRLDMNQTHRTPIRRNGMSIRRAHLRDMPRVAQIVRSSASWYEPFVDDSDMDQHDVDAAWGRDNFKKRDFYVGEVDDTVVGTVTLQDAGMYSYLGYVYLHADYTGRGLGKELLRHARDESRRRGHHGMVLIAHPEADWATRAYKRFGFECIAREEDDVKSWNDGFLAPYYEKGFHLFRYAHEATA